MFNRLAIFSLLLLSFCFTQTLQAQTYSLSNRLPVSVNSNSIRNPWAGGINAGQFLPFDLNRDGIKDLVIFDREDFTFSTYINYGSNGQVDYEYTPEYIRFFPDTCNGFVAFYDYNGDEYEDCFCGTPTSRILAFKNKGNPNTIEFELVEAPISSYYGQNYLWAYAARNDYNAFDDVDYDGDMDFLVFEILGGRMEFHKNVAVENGWSLDSLVFEVESQCYGNMIEDPANCTAYLDQSSFPCMGSNILPPQDDEFNALGESSALHAGSTILSLDLNGDNLKDVVLGDIDCPQLYALYNGGTQDTAHFDSLENFFPFYDTPVDVDMMPAAFYLDVNNDDKKDLICAPNRLDNVQNIDGVTYHRNLGQNNTPNFSFQKYGFMQDDMIEMGSGSAPSFVDYNADGLVDMIVGNRGIFTGPGTRSSGLSLYENVGSEFYPIFNMIDDDFLGLKQDTTLKDLMATFADIDSDGDIDMLLGELEGTVMFYENTAGAGATANWVKTASAVYDTIDVGYNAAPQWVDLDGDQDYDLIIGNEQGQIHYYENIGSMMMPDIELITRYWGGIDLEGQFTNGHSKPFVYDYDEDGTDELMLGGLSGWVEIYEDLSIAPGDTFTYSGNFANHDFGSFSTPSASVLDSINGIRFFVGNMRGGIQLYDKAPVFVSRDDGYVPPAPEELSLTVFPNPGDHRINWKLEGPSALGSVQVQVRNLLGGNVFYDNTHLKVGALDVSTFPIGVYFLTVQSKSYQVTKKFVVSR